MSAYLGQDVLWPNMLALVKKIITFIYILMQIESSKLNRRPHNALFEGETKLLIADM